MSVSTSTEHSSCGRFPVLSDRIRTWIFLGLILCGILVLAFCVMQSKSENKIYAANMNTFTAAQEAFQAEQYDTASELLAELIPSYRDSSQALFLKGLILSRQGDFAAAEEILTQARQKNVRLVENQQFVYAYGEVMFNLQEYAAAQQYFLKSIQLNKNETFTQASQASLQKIAALTGGETHE